MTAPITLTQDQEAAINVALHDLVRLESCKDILTAATYRASQRSVLRNLVKRTHVNTLVADGYLMPKSSPNVNVT